MRINNQNTSNPSFTSVIPTRVIINNHISIHPQNVKKAVRGLQKILTNPANEDESIKAIKAAFCTNVKDFQYFAGAKYESGTLIRNITDVDIAKFTERLPDEGLAYLFTGNEVLELAKKGRTIGPERTKSDKYVERFGNIINKLGINAKKEKGERVRSFEELEKDITYYDKIKAFLAKPKLFLKSAEGKDKGAPVELIINAIKDVDGKIKIKNIFFSPIKKVEEPIEVKPQALSNRSRIKKKIKTIIKDSQTKLLF